MRITLDDSDLKNTTRPKRNKEISKESPLINNRNSKNTIKKATKIIFSITGVLFAVFLTYGGYMLYKTYKAGTMIGFNFKPSDVISQELPTLKKDSTGKYTNALLVGIDTRETGNLLNTDSIILASYNHDTKELILLSIPRDFNVQVNSERVWYNRINSVYSTYEQQGEDEGLLRLRDVVTEITGKEIQYHAMIDYKGFTELIDTLGGIEINVENSFTDYRYPDNSGYKTVSFSQGPQTMDGKTALEYSRSRHSLQNAEGSDFARARRQQNVIAALTSKLTSTSLLDPQSLMNVFNVIQDNVKISDFDLNEIEAGITELKEFKENGEIYSFVLDPNAGAGKLVSNLTLDSGAYAIGPVEGLGNYSDIRKYITNVWDNPPLYEEDPVIRIYNTGLGYTPTLEEYNKLTEEYPYLKIYYAGTLYADKDNVITYVNAENGFENSFKSINEYIKPDITEKPEYITTNLNGEDITVLYGKKLETEVNVDQTE
jgi:LCP family protein required for cell wall assembly